jgi:hypothetical protein
MMGLNLNEIVAKIKKEKGLSDEEIKLRISQKRDKLTGLVSEEGAAHILANELGIDLMESIRKHGLKIAKLQPGMRVGVTGKVIKNYEVRSFNKNGRSGKVGSFLIGDDTGLVRIVLWDVNHITKMENGEIKPDTIIKVENANVRENNGYKEMHLSSYSDLIINPEGVGEIKVVERKTDGNFGGEVKLKKLNEIAVGEFASIYGTIVQMFEPRFYEGCSECGRKAVDGKCNEHQNASIKKIPVLNFFIDDGYEGMRAVVFRDQAAKIMGISSEEFEKFSDNVDAFNDAKNNVLGNQMVMSGKVTSNEMYNRKEFMVRSIHEMKAEEILGKFLNQ